MFTVVVVIFFCVILLLISFSLLVFLRRVLFLFLLRILFRGIISFTCCRCRCCGRVSFSSIFVRMVAPRAGVFSFAIGLFGGVICLLFLLPRRVTIKVDVDYYDSFLKLHKNENFFASDFEFCPISLLALYKY